MTNRWIRHRPGPEENRRAGAVALGAGVAVAAVIFYFLRFLLAREPVRRDARPGAPGRLPDGEE